MASNGPLGPPTAAPTFTPTALNPLYSQSVTVSWGAPTKKASWAGNPTYTIALTRQANSIPISLEKSTVKADGSGSATFTAVVPKLAPQSPLAYTLAITGVISGGNPAKAATSIDFILPKFTVRHP